MSRAENSCKVTATCKECNQYVKTPINIPTHAAICVEYEANNCGVSTFDKANSCLNSDICLSNSTTHSCQCRRSYLVNIESGDCEHEWQQLVSAHAI